MKLLTAAEVIEILGISPRHFFRLKAAGELPKPVRFRKSVRWVQSDIEEWVRSKQA